LVVGDIYNISERIRELDPDLFLSGKPPRYEIWRHNETVYGDRPQFVMYWDKPLDARLLKHLRYSDSWSGYRDIIRELDEDYEKRLKAEEKDLKELADEAAKDIHKAVLKDTG